MEGAADFQPSQRHRGSGRWILSLVAHFPLPVRRRHWQGGASIPASQRTRRLGAGHPPPRAPLVQAWRWRVVTQPSPLNCLGRDQRRHGRSQCRLGRSPSPVEFGIVLSAKLGVAFSPGERSVRQYGVTLLSLPQRIIGGIAKQGAKPRTAADGDNCRTQALSRCNHRVGHHPLFCHAHALGEIAKITHQARSHDGVGSAGQVLMTWRAA